MAETCSTCAAYITSVPRLIRHSLLLVAAIGFDANWNKHPLDLVAGAVSGHGQRSAASVSGAPMAHGWDNFFIMAGSSAATLIGLLFVAIRNRDQTH